MFLAIAVFPSLGQLNSLSKLFDCMDDEEYHDNKGKNLTLDVEFHRLTLNKTIFGRIRKKEEQPRHNKDFLCQRERL